MKKILMTLTYGRACSRSTKQTSSFGARLIATFAAVLCCAVISTVFTACSSENESVSDLAAYTLGSKGDERTITSSNCQEIMDKMKNALIVGLGDEHCICKRDDDKAIRICDQVYNSVTPVGYFVIELKVTPFGNGVNNQSIVIKKYENK